MSEKKLNPVLLEKAARVKLLLMDCDGVLTDGRLYYSERGEEIKVFHVRDGQGLVNWHRAGFISGIITGRKSKILEVRAVELGISHLRQASGDKVSDFERMIKEEKVSAAETAFIGDDLVDLPVLEKAGLAVAVADAVGELFPKADYITQTEGGRGAVREVIDLLFLAKGL